MSKNWKVPKEYKKIYSQGFIGKHFDEEDEKYATLLRNIFSTLNEVTYEEYFHQLLFFEETKDREILQKLSVERVKLVRDTPRATVKQFYNTYIPELQQKKRYVRNGDPILLVSNLDSLKIIATISKMDMIKNIITILVSRVPYNVNLVNKHFKLIFLFSKYKEEYYLNMHKTLHKILSHVHKTKVFPKKNIKCNKKDPIITWFNPDIAKNVEQRTAVEHIVANTSSPAPYILHGPPGTGKTATVVEAILQVLRVNPSSRILVCAPSNSAADDLACKLISYKYLLPTNTEHHFLLRPISESRDWSTLPQCLKIHTWKPHESKENPSYLQHMKSVLMKTKLIVSTISYALYAAKNMPITHLFIDEAAQATEPSCLVAIHNLLVPGGLLVLSGDPLQLGPVLNSQVAKEYGLGLSLMERLMKDQLYDATDPNYSVMLKKSFRCHADILQIPNNRFYGGQLEACVKEDFISKRNILNNKNNCRAIVFYAVFGTEAKEKGSSSYFNADELMMLKFLINQLVTGKYKEKPEDIGIITPYIAQVVKIREWLHSKEQMKIEVGSVESYQGREKKIIFISTVRGVGKDTRTNVKLGFLADLKRFNVAVTRAKAKLIVIGNPNCLKTDEMWGIYIERCKEIGSYHEIDSLLAARLQAMQIA